MRLKALMATGGALALFAPAGAQQLSAGDYELCSVYDRQRDFAGYDSACLAGQRAAVHRYDRKAPSSSAYASGVYFCPHWANQGRGYSAYSPGAYGAYAYVVTDAPVNGRRCTPRPVNYQGTGYY